MSQFMDRDEGETMAEVEMDSAEGLAERMGSVLGLAAEQAGRAVVAMMAGDAAQAAADLVSARTMLRGARNGSRLLGHEELLGRCTRADAVVASLERLVRACAVNQPPGAR